MEARIDLEEEELWVNLRTQLLDGNEGTAKVADEENNATTGKASGHNSLASLLNVYTTRLDRDPNCGRYGTKCNHCTKTWGATASHASTSE